MSRVTSLRRNLLEIGVYCREDIEEICQAEAEYDEECRKITEACAREGIPDGSVGHASRCAAARRKCDSRIAAITFPYDLEEAAGCEDGEGEDGWEEVAATFEREAREARKRKGMRRGILGRLRDVSHRMLPCRRAFRKRSKGRKDRGRP